MGLKTLLVLTCDGPGCDLTWTGEPSDQRYEGIQPMAIEMKKQTIWSGHLCGACETKFYNALVSAIPRS